MMPWGHFAVALLPYLAYSLLARRDLPSRRAVLFLLVATQLPDLIDKPLAWGVHLLPSGRSLSHSLLFAVPLVVLVAVILHRRGAPELGPLFAFGYLTHVFGDVYRALLSVPPGQWTAADVASLFWPLLPVQSQESTDVLYYFLRVEPTRYAQVAVGVVLFGVCVAAPEIRTAIRRWRRRADGDPAKEADSLSAADHSIDAE